jgi:hypothetical protein
MARGARAIVVDGPTGIDRECATNEDPVPGGLQDATVIHGEVVVVHLAGERGGPSDGGVSVPTIPKQPEEV